MIVCGVELTGSDAVVCLLNLDRGQFSLPECKVRKLSLRKNHTREDLKQFQAEFAALMAEHEVGCVAIKERMPKGKFAGGAVGFKLEAAIELIADLDVVIMLRLQKERMEGALLPSEREFYRLYGLNQDKLALAKPDCIVMHPGPINRGVEIESAVADGPQSVILNQVTNGIAIRMAVMSMAMGGQVAERQQKHSDHEGARA